MIKNYDDANCFWTDVTSAIQCNRNNAMNGIFHWKIFNILQNCIPDVQCAVLIMLKFCWLPFSSRANRVDASFILRPSTLLTLYSCSDGFPLGPNYSWEKLIQSNLMNSIAFVMILMSVQFPSEIVRLQNIISKNHLLAKGIKQTKLSFEFSWARELIKLYIYLNILVNFSTNMNSCV